jgi:hypothetical protein
MLDRWRRERRDGEAFGDWANVALFSGEALALV